MIGLKNKLKVIIPGIILIIACLGFIGFRIIDQNQKVEAAKEKIVEESKKLDSEIEEEKNKQVSEESIKAAETKKDEKINSLNEKEKELEDLKKKKEELEAKVKE